MSEHPELKPELVRRIEALELDVHELKAKLQALLESYRTYTGTDPVRLRAPVVPESELAQMRAIPMTTKATSEPMEWKSDEHQSEQTK